MQPQLFSNSYVHTALRLDPRTKLYLLVIFSIVLVDGGTTGILSYAKPILAAIPFLLLLTAGRRNVALTYAAIFSLSWLFSIYEINFLNGMINILLSLFARLGIRWFPCAVMGYYLLVSTHVSEFVAAMERMHVTQKITIPLSVMFRFFPTVQEEYRSIRDAMNMRGIGIRNFFSNPTAMLEYQMVPLMMSVVTIGNELSAAALTRGLYGTVKRTSICKIGFAFWDLIFFLLATSVFIAFIISKL